MAVSQNIASMRRLLFAAVVLSIAADSSAQIVESVGNRAQGMGGAFVAVAADSTATWWNPAGLATGPFSDASLGRGFTDLLAGAPARRDRVSWFAATSPAVGFSYYRLRITDIRGFGPTGQDTVNRQDTRAEVSVRSFSASELGLTVVQSILPGVHAGATLKYVRGTLRAGADDGTRAADDLLDRGEDLDGGDAENAFDLDAGLIGQAGALRIGAVMRNVRHPRFGGDAFELPRQTRVGVAIDAEKAGGPPLILALDADVKTYATGSGDRRVIAAGAEQWLFRKRIGIRGGARFNRVGAKERAATAGLSLAARNGMWVEGQIVRGGSEAERGWGLGARVSF
jgi:F plasmid transfer operon protein TraF